MSADENQQPNPTDPPQAIAPPALTEALARPASFEFDEVTPVPRAEPAPAPPSLGPLASFVGDWQGNGLNTIFRPDNPKTPTSTTLPKPLPPGDNVLEINFTAETLSFSKELGRVPNRAELPSQGDIFLNGIPYLQSIEDLETSPPKGIHFEPGLWMIVPETENPQEPTSLVRMASIPHGTTICAQGTAQTVPGAPQIPPNKIRPFEAGDPGRPVPFPSEDTTNPGTARIPQDLQPFLNSGQITQQILEDPTTLLREHLSGQRIQSTTTIEVHTSAIAPLFGGGTDNIAFLLGNRGALSNPNPAGQNAQTLEMSATFWIEDVIHTVLVPIFRPGSPPLILPAQTQHPGTPTPTFIVRPPIPIDKPREITIVSKQIQYSQRVILNFNTLSWPHVSVATLVPAAPTPVPPSIWD